jgi:Cu(I)/Ag(I) efflux system membrane protein CusA/SilA
MISSENGLLLATVLLNVQDRDVGGFVEEAKARVARDVVLPPGYFLDWSGRWENQERAWRQLMVVVPIVLLIIFVLLYFTYHSVVEAAHVLLAVPFALTGGVYLVWLLGYNFSVAVWVGFIALFGTAVQTGVVMVIYLEEAVQRKLRERGGALSRAELRGAVMEGALLRLRPKVMTVATVVASLLPIMWSSAVGAEVMKPLATPVIGGMVSSLLHVLVVTPVIFFWIHERRLGLHREAMPPIARAAPAGRRTAVIALAALMVGAGAVALWRAVDVGDRAPDDEAGGEIVQAVVAGDLRILLRAPSGVLRTGRNSFVLEFRRAGTDTLVDVGTARAAASMPMPGMAMSGALQLQPTDRAGRYAATAEFGMAGSWQFAVEWDGPAGRGSISFEGSVQ